MLTKRENPLIKKISEPGGRLDPRIHSRMLELPARHIVNTRHDMALLDLYVRGILKWPDTGKTCGNCVNYYPDPHSRTGGRCRAKGFSEVHQDWPADERQGFTDPVSQAWFRYWPSCNLYISKERLSLR